MSILTADRLRELVDYCPETGVMRWKVKRWRALPGDVCGTPHPSSLRVRIEQRCYLVHRLAWLYVHGQWPEGDIDHIDGNPFNNRLSNLRTCNQAQNQQNRSARGSKRNTSGHACVSWDASRGAWMVRIRAHGRNHFGGRFQSIDEAVAARDRLKAEVHTFQPRHRDLQRALEAPCEVTRLAEMLRAA